MALNIENLGCHTGGPNTRGRAMGALDRRHIDAALPELMCFGLEPLDATTDVPTGEVRHIDGRAWGDDRLPAFQCAQTAFRD